MLIPDTLNAEWNAYIDIYRPDIHDQRYPDGQTRTIFGFNVNGDKIEKDGKEGAEETAKITYPLYLTFKALRELPNVPSANNTIRARIEAEIINSHQELKKESTGPITKTAPGADPLSPSERIAIEEEINQAVSRGEFAIFTINDAVRELLQSRGPPQIANILNDLDSGLVKLRAIDIGPYPGFLRKDTSKDRYVYAYTTKESNLVYINITTAFRFLFDSSFSYFLKESLEKLEKELTTKTKDLSKETDAAKQKDLQAKLSALEKDIRFLKEFPAAVLGQVIIHEYSEAVTSFSHEQASALEITLSSNYALTKGISDLDLFILDHAAREGALSYLVSLSGSSIPQSTLVEALRKLLFLHYRSSDIKAFFVNHVQEELRLAASGALKDIRSAVESSLGKSRINKGQDIRGVAYQYIPYKQEEVNAEIYYRLGRAAVSITRCVLGKEQLKIASGKDVRIHSKYLQQALISGIRSKGANVVDIGFKYTSTPMVSSAVYSYPDLDGAIQVTASHNDFSFNGVKFILGKENMSEELINKLFILAYHDDLDASLEGDYEQRDYWPLYQKEVADFIRERFTGVEGIDQERPFTGRRYAVEGVSGASGETFIPVLLGLGVKDSDIVRIHTRPNGYFPYHIPNPDEKPTKECLLSALKADPTIDSGVAFDSDGDRLFFGEKSGKNVTNHAIICMFALKIPGPMVVNSRTTMAAKETKLSRNEPFQKSKSGYVYVKDAGRKLKATAAVEESGHFMFSPTYVDDGMRSAGMVFAFIAQEGKSVNEIVKATTYPEFTMVTINPRLPSDLPKEDCLKFVQSFTKSEIPYFQANFTGIEILTIDGLLVEFAQDANRPWRGWFQFRQSLSEPTKLYIDYEATSAEGIRELNNILREALKRHEADLPKLSAVAAELSNEKIEARLPIKKDSARP
ncbi:MAG: hypothetical protein PHQ91_15980, partial [Thermoanaerobaculaceae bacterium]|nr:hypothetical protein [Thermoanaerobaculaceae bacterium]